MSISDEEDNPYKDDEEFDKKQEQKLLREKKAKKKGRTFYEKVRNTFIKTDNTNHQMFGLMIVVVAIFYLQSIVQGFAPQNTTKVHVLKKHTELKPYWRQINKILLITKKTRKQINKIEIWKNMEQNHEDNDGSGSSFKVYYQQFRSEKINYFKVFENFYFLENESKFRIKQPSDKQGFLDTELNKLIQADFEIIDYKYTIKFKSKNKRYKNQKTIYSFIFYKRRDYGKYCLSNIVINQDWQSMNPQNKCGYQDQF